MGITTKLKLRRRPNKKGEYGIVLQVILNKKVTELSTKVAVKKDLFDSNKQMIRNRHPNEVELNKQIHDFKNKYDQAIYDLKNTPSTKPYTISDIHERVNGKIITSNERSFCDFIEDALDRNIEDWKHSTLVSYRSTLSKLKSYNATELLEDIDENYALGYKSYLQEVREVSENSIKKEMKNLRKFVNIASRKNLIKNNPFENITIGEISSKREYLTSNELYQFEAVETKSKSQTLVKDAFTLGAYTGLRISDILTLKPSNLQETESGLYRLSKVAKKKAKAKKEVVLEFTLNTKASKILRDYYVEKNEYIFPPLITLPSFDDISIDKKISSTTAYFNKILKKLIAKAKINKRITFHCSRHTFASRIISSDKGDINTLAEVLGHRKLQSTKIYAKIMNDKKDKLLKILDD